MIGLIFLVIFGGLFLGYSWLAYRGVFAIYRKTKSLVLAGFIIIIFILIPTGDTIFNRWYHQNVLCKRDDVGLKIFEKVQLPLEYFEADGMLNKEVRSKAYDGKKILNRYEWKDVHASGGVYTFTGYVKDTGSVIDTNTGKVISQFSDYRNGGGGWWLIGIDFIIRKFTYNGTGFTFGGNVSCFQDFPTPRPNTLDALYKGFVKPLEK